MSELFIDGPFASMSIFFGIILISIGILFKVKPPESINSIYGFRTPSSMKDQAHWDYAHQYSAKLSIYLGLACMAASSLGRFLQLSEITETFVGVGWLILISIILIYRTEKALKKRFDP